MILIRVRLTHMLEVKLVHNWTVLPQNLFHLKYLVHFLRQNSSFILVSYLIWKNYCLIFEFFLDFPLLLLPAYYLHFVNPLVQFPFLPVPQFRIHSRQFILLVLLMSNQLVLRDLLLVLVLLNVILLILIFWIEKVCDFFIVCILVSSFHFILNY